MDKRGRGQTQEMRVGGVEVGRGRPWQDRKPVRVGARVPDLRRKLPRTKRRGRTNKLTNEESVENQPSTSQGSVWGGGALNISDNKHRSTTPEKQEKTGAYLSSTSCLSLKHDQKHTHLIISVKYSFNKVCVVKNHVILSPS